MPIISNKSPGNTQKMYRTRWRERENAVTARARAESIDVAILFYSFLRYDILIIISY